MRSFKQGTLIPLTLKLSDGRSDRFVRAKVYNQSFALVGTYNLAHVDTGLYGVQITLSTAGSYTVFYEVFSNSGYTNKDNRYSDAEECILIDDIDNQVNFLANKIDDGDGRIS